MNTTEYVAVVEVATRLEQLEPEASEALRDYQPVFGRSSRGWIQVTLSISATGLAHACATAAAMARVGTGAEALACQVMTRPEYDARLFSEGGRHAAYGGSVPLLPRQASGSARSRHDQSVDPTSPRDRGTAWPSGAPAPRTPGVGSRAAADQNVF